MATSVPDAVPSDYQGGSIEAAYRQGWSAGHGVACHCVPSLGDRIRPDIDYVGLGRVVNAANIREWHELLCHAQVTPGEFETLADEEAWEAGKQAAIAADLAEYENEQYGLAAAKRVLRPGL